MTPNELQQLFAIRGIKAKVKGNEVQVHVCTYCGNDRWNLEVNVVLGVVHCWTCSARGRAQTYIEQVLGVSVNIAVVPFDPKKHSVRPNLPTGSPVRPLEHEWATGYLKKRGLDTIDSLVYEIGEGAENDSSWGGRVVFPVRDYWTRELAGYLGRAVVPSVRPKYYAQWQSGHKQITGYTNRSDVHVVVEGIFDGVRVHQAGFNSVVLGGVSEREVESWGARVNPAHAVVVLLDADAQDQAHRLYWRIYPVHQKVYVIDLPEGVDPAVLEPLVIRAAIKEKISK